jgi:hypothetical protein
VFIKGTANNNGKGQTGKRVKQVFFHVVDFLVCKVPGKACLQAAVTRLDPSLVEEIVVE